MGRRPRPLTVTLLLAMAAAATVIHAADRVSGDVAAAGPQGRLLSVYDAALPHVYGYLRSRCGRSLAEDLTAETFLGAVDAARRPDPPDIDTPWLLGVGRHKLIYHKLIYHWRRQAREEPALTAVGELPAAEDPWGEQLDAMHARTTLDRLGAHHRATLTLRYVDDLPVAQVAALLGRTLHATEALLVRARMAFRRAYESEEAGNG